METQLCPLLLIKGPGGVNMHHSKNVAYYALVKTQPESTPKQHAIKLTDLNMIFFADNENNGVKQHHFPSSSIQEYAITKKITR